MEFCFPQAHSRLTPSRGMLYLSLSPSWNCCLDSTNPQFLRGNFDNQAEAPFSEQCCLFSEVLACAEQVKFSILFHLCLCRLAFFLSFEGRFAVWNKVFSSVF